MDSKRSFCCFLSVLMIAFLLSACGGQAASTQVPTDAPPTLTPFPTFAFVEPTKVAVFEQTDDETPAATEVGDNDAVALDPKMVERGLGRYEALECGSCHGANGEGSDKAAGLLDFALSEDDFITFVRSGGELGPSHQYSTDRLSNSGSRNLYQYLLSLASGD